MFAGVELADMVTGAGTIGAVVAGPIALYATIKFFPKALAWGKRLLAGK